MHSTSTPVRASVRVAAVPSWEELRAALQASPTTQRIESEAAERAVGGGPAHQDNRLRLFGKREEDVRVTFYRDHAGVRTVVGVDITCSSRTGRCLKLFGNICMVTDFAFVFNLRPHHSGVHIVRNFG